MCGTIMLCRGCISLSYADFEQSKSADISTILYGDVLGLYHINATCVMHLSSEKSQSLTTMVKTQRLCIHFYTLKCGPAVGHRGTVDDQDNGTDPEVVGRMGAGKNAPPPVGYARHRQAASWWCLCDKGHRQRW